MGGRETRSNESVWVAGSRAMTRRHRQAGCLMGRSRFVGEVLSGRIPSCERTKEVKDKAMRMFFLFLVPAFLIQSFTAVTSY